MSNSFSNYILTPNVTFASSVNKATKDIASSEDAISLNELYTLKEVYDIEFGVRGYWKCIFDNSPIKYKKKAMIAKSCNESDYNNGFDAHRVGLIEVYTPGHLQMPTLQIEFYDDTDSTIERWLRSWKDSMKDKTTQTLTYIDSYVTKATIFQYNQHHVLQSTREYLVAPAGKISVSNESAAATTITLNFIVFNMKIL